MQYNYNVYRHIYLYIHKFTYNHTYSHVYLWHIHTIWHMHINVDLVWYVTESRCQRDLLLGGCCGATKACIVAIAIAEGLLGSLNFSLWVVHCFSFSFFLLSLSLLESFCLYSLMRISTSSICSAFRRSACPEHRLPLSSTGWALQEMRSIRCGSMRGSCDVKMMTRW